MTIAVAIDSKIGLQKNHIVIAIPAGILIARVDQIRRRWIGRSTLRGPLMNLMMKRASVIGRKLDVPLNCQIGVGVHFPAVLQASDFVAVIVHIEIGVFETLGKLIFKSRNPALGSLTQKSLVPPVGQREREYLVHRISVVIHVIRQTFHFSERIRFGHEWGGRFSSIEGATAVADNLRRQRS